MVPFSLQLPLQQTASSSDMERLLEHYLGGLPLEDDETLSATPVVVSREYMEEMDLLCPVLHKALQAVVLHYFRDGRIRDIFSLDKEMEAVLRMAEGLPYSVGLYRPRFLYDRTGHPRIYSIAARSPLNGWMLSHYLNRIGSDLQLTSGMQTLRPVPGQLDFPDRLFRRFDLHRPLTLVHDQEKGTEVFYLLEIFRRRGMDWLQVRPQDLEYTDGEVHYRGKYVSQFIFEIGGEELRNFRPEVIHHIIRTGNLINDVRSLILVHDHRMLAVLYDQHIMEDYLQPEEYARLRSYLLPSFALHTQANREAVIASPRNWVLKRNHGQGELDMLVKEHCLSHDWSRVIRLRWTEFMAQHFAEQYRFRYTTGQASPIRLSGMLLCYDDRHCGPGFFRGTADAFIPSMGERSFIFPAMVQSPAL